MTLEDKVESTVKLIELVCPTFEIACFRRLMKRFESAPELGIRTAEALGSYVKAFTDASSESFASLIEVLQTHDLETVPAIAETTYTSVSRLHPSTLIETYDSKEFRQMITKFDRVIGKILIQEIADLTSSLRNHKENSTLIDMYGSDQFAELMESLSPKGRAVISAAYMQSVNLVYMITSREDFLGLLYDNREDERVAVQIARSAVNLARVAWNRRSLSVYCEACRQLSGYEPFVYDELSECVLGSEGAIDLIKEEHDFFRQQPPETVIPLISVMYRIEKEYRPLIKNLDCKEKLAQAYCIAKDNVDEDSAMNYLSLFYAGLKRCLEKRPGDLGRWAASIVNDFREQGEKGLLRGIQR